MFTHRPHNRREAYFADKAIAKRDAQMLETRAIKRRAERELRARYPNPLVRTWRRAFPENQYSSSDPEDSFLVNVAVLLTVCTGGGFFALIFLPPAIFFTFVPERFHPQWYKDMEL